MPVGAGPIITQFLPSSGGPGTRVKISGANLGDVEAVTFNGAFADFVLISSTQISATVPFDATIGPISVTSLSGTAISAQDFIVSPLIFDFTPARGPPGKVITIDGANFLNVSAVKFNGTSATVFRVTGFNQLQATVPSLATTGPISVTSPAGTAVSTNNFLITGTEPIITGFSPSSGPPGTLVTIDGEEFSGTSAVKFGDKNAASFILTSMTQIQAAVPIGATNGPIRVTTALGTGMSTSNFIVTGLAPFIVDFSPRNGSPGTPVVIEGANFAQATVVSFNGTNTTFAVTSSTQIHAIVPAKATSGSISVTSPFGTGFSPNAFTVTGPGPIITDFSPAIGQPGTPVVINGANFNGVTAVKFSGINAGFTLTASTQLHATVPPGATNGPISIITPLGTGLSADSFIVISAGPLITDFSPTGGPPGSRVVINGANLLGTTKVWFNETPVPTFTVTSPTQLHATVPLGASSGPIRVLTTAGTAVSTNSFIVTPRVNNFSPSHGPVGSLVTISGANLLNANLVLFNGTPAIFNAESQSQIRASVPEGATTGPLSVANPGGATSSIDDFTVTVAADLSASATASPDPATLGSNLSYRISITNRGPDMATGVIMTNFFSPLVTFISAMSSRGNCAFVNGSLVCNLGTLPEGSNVVVNIVTSPLGAGSITNRTTVMGHEPDTVLTNNTVTLVTGIVSSTVPRLTISSSGNNVLISWPASAGDFVLEAAKTLAPGVTWGMDASPPITIGDRKVIVVNGTSGQKFYRLHRF